MVKKAVLLAAAFLVAFSLVSVFAGGAKETPSGGPVKLTWYFWTGSQAEVDFWTSLAKRVTAKYPNITIDFVTDSFVAFWNKVQLMAASNTTTDIMGLQFQRSLGYGSAYVALDPYIAKDPGLNMSDFDNTILPALRYQGKQIALPYDFGPDIIFINKDMFDARNVPYPAKDWTMDDFIKTCAALSGDGKYGMSFSSWIDFIIPFIFSDGGRYIDDTGTWTLTDPGTVKAFTMIRDMVKNGSAVPFVTTSDTEWHSENWTGGVAAMHVNGPWMTINFLSSAKFKIGIANIPAGPAGAGNVTAGSGFGIGKDSKHPLEAFEAITELTSKESSILIAQAGRGFPGRKSAQPAFFDGHNGVPADWQPIMTSLIAGAKPFVITPTWNQATDLIFRNLIPIFNGETPVDQGLSNLNQRLNGLQQ
jgi:multiple sugar transport system substrate-binding protein